MKEKAKNLTKEFLDFLKEYKVVGLAIGVVMGLASNQLVKSLVDNVLTPIISAFIPSSRLEEVIISFWKINIKIGLFLNDILYFFIVALVIFFVVKFFMKKANEEAKK